jgi:leucine dehydrogenase
LRDESIESAIRDWDGESVLVRFDPPTAAWIFIAIHSTRLGPAGGGTRMKHYESPGAALRDALQLASAMTRKFAVPGLPHGGGKAVIDLPTEFDPALRPGLLRRYGALVRSLGGLYLTGPDVGSSETDMDVIAETGAPYVFGTSPAHGGRGHSGEVTATGVFAGIEVVCEHLFNTPSLAGRSVLVQGAGNVGVPLIQKLRAAGATVLVNDIDKAAVRPKLGHGAGIEFVDSDRVFETRCDIFSPCALGGVLNAQTIPRLRCSAIVGAANNQLAASADAALLQERGILYAPDYVVNVGGAMGLLGMGTLDWSPERAEREISTSVRKALREVVRTAVTDGITTEAAAEALAQRHLAAGRPA